MVDTALKQNFELRIAAERVLQARAAYGITRADQFPAVDVSGSVTALRNSEVGATRGIPQGVDTSVSYTQFGFSLGWELDVWGRLRRLSEAARAQYLATEEARQAVITTLVADVTDTYLALRALDLELEIATRTRDVAANNLQLIEERRNAGIASGLDVQQAEQLLYTATGQMASLEREIAQAENALSLLLGQAPADVPRGRPLEAFQAPPSVPVGLPSALLERRPDIRQAEQQLIAANAEIGAAKAEYFPRISLTGFFGGQSRALAELLTGPGRIASASLGATAPIFNAGKTRANVRLAEAVKGEARRELPACDLHGASGRGGLAGRLREDERAARPAGTARGSAARLGTAVHRALPGRTGQLSARARRAAESVRRRAPARAAPPAAACRRSCSCIARSAAGGRHRRRRRQPW